jgi:hypothetical protein
VHLFNAALDGQSSHALTTHTPTAVFGVTAPMLSSRVSLIVSETTDGGGFEPPVPFGTHALQACTINHSVTHPERSPSSLTIDLSGSEDNRNK